MLFMLQQLCMKSKDNLRRQEGEENTTFNSFCFLTAVESDETRTYLGRF